MHDIFCSYIITTKEVHPYAEENILYLNNINSILDATINAKIFLLCVAGAFIVSYRTLIAGDPLCGQD